MESKVYAVEAEIEATHWWFVGRRQLFSRLISRHDVSLHDRVLDIGTSTGTNLRLLAQLGFENRVGLDNDDEAIRWCAEKGLGVVTKGNVCKLPFRDREFRLVLATDIIEHVDDDITALREIHRVLAPGGIALISVPAFQSLWGLQDEVSLHKRRYSMDQLLARIAESGLRCTTSFYFNYLLFLPIWMARKFIRLFKVRVGSENQLNSPLMNQFLAAIFSLDVASAETVRPPFGVSIVALVERA